jgi:hypothetical protein
VVRVCCRFHFVACCSFKKRPFVNFKRYPPVSPGRFTFFGNQVISEIRSRRPNRERPFCFFFLAFSNGTRPAIFFLFNITNDYCIRYLCCLPIFVPVKAFFYFIVILLRVLSPFISSLFNVAFCFVYLSLFNVALCFAEFSHRLNVTLVRLN